MEKNLAVMSA